MKLIYYCILLLLFTACGSSKKAIKTEEQIARMDNITLADSAIKKERKTVLEKQELDNTFAFEMIEYDTDKPIIEATGLPPIKTVVTASKGSRTKKETNSNETTEEVRLSTANKITQEEQIYKKQDVADKNPTNVVRDVTKLIWATVVLGICIAVWWLIKKRK